MLLIYFLIINTLTFALYGIDKKKAQKDKFRVPERTLIIFALLGGAIGAGLAMLFFRHKIRKKKFYILVPILIVLDILVTAFCFYQNLHIVVTEYDYTSEKVPENRDGYRIVQISDLHNQFFGFDQGYLIDKIKDADPDIIYVTGDAVDAYHTNYSLAIKFFEQAVKIAPVCYITGNHEVWLKGERFNSFLAEIEELGVHFMDDQVLTVDDYMLIGIADEDLNNPDIGLSISSLSICLAHEPAYYKKYMELGVDIVFTGHMHGGQFIIPGKGGVFSPDFGLFPELYEGEHVYDYGDGNTMTMYISRGLGNSAIPLRLNNYPEIVVVTLHSAE